MTSREMVFDVIKNLASKKKTPITKDDILTETQKLGLTDTTVWSYVKEFVRKGILRKSLNKRGLILIRDLKTWLN